MQEKADMGSTQKIMIKNNCSSEYMQYRWMKMPEG